MQTNYFTTIVQNGKELIILLLMCLLQTSSVLAYSTYVPADTSVCDEFLASHGGQLNSTVARTKRVWVELWDQSKQNQQSCFEHGVSYKVSIRAMNTVTNQPAHIKGFLFGTTTGTLPGDEYGDLPRFASELKCRENEIGRRRKRVYHKRPVAPGTDLTFNYAPSTNKLTMEETFRAAVTFTKEENLENLKFIFPVCRNETSSTVMLQATSTITPSPSSTYTISPTANLTLSPTSTLTFTPTPAPQCSCNSSTTPSCGKEIQFHNRTLKHFNAATNKTYHCQSKMALRNVTCTNTCKRECPTYSGCAINVDCTVDSKLKPKKFNCYELDSRGNIINGAKSVLLKLVVTMNTGCTCRQRGHL